MSLTMPTSFTKPISKSQSLFTSKLISKSILCSTSDPSLPSSQPQLQPLKSLTAALALSSILLSSTAAPPLLASADIAGLTPCKESKQFLESAMKQYAPDSAPALALKATMEKTKRSGDQRHWGEFITPGILFLYIAGWIGWVGRSYLIAIRDDKKPTQKEIIIDVALASRLLWRGFFWPVAAYREYLNGELVVDDADVTVV
ncbi:hypothetical protein NE237_031551 [Protea cynaroides]|uniref:Photosystem I reaction center subunit III n=1 Tax=Protea cynaroides TaxID=273540 RepID=A0A9Q0R2J9_9MAGN|nr:hypothetical protein NE237_031551 [Protea cynaroides]